MIGSAIATSQLGREVRDIDLNDVLGVLGLARTRNHVAQNLALLGVGVVVGAGVALLLAPESGEETRKRLTQGVDKLTDQVAEKFGQVKQEATQYGSSAANRANHVS